jgi:phosphate-selective porin OprO/OprP
MGENTKREGSRFWRRAALGAATSVAALAVAGAASADPATDAKIAALEAQLEQLKSQITDLKQSTSSDIADVRATAAANQVTLSNGRPTIASADGQQKFAIRGLVQFDAAKYFEDGPAGSNDLNSGTNFRRARLGIEGTFAKDWNYALTGEFGGSGGESTTLNQAYVEYAGWKPLSSLVNPVRLRIGAWATPAGLEDATSNTESLFLERAASAEIVRNFAGGDGRTGIGAFANGDRWFANAAVTGAVIGTPSAAEFDEQTGYLARAAWLPLKGANSALHVGANVTGVLDPADTANGGTTKQIRLRERPELRVDGTRLVDTGNLNADGLTAYGAEVGWFWNNLYAAGEYYWIDVDRTGSGAANADLNFNGWYAQAAWTITGEKHEWNPATGGFRGIRPAKPFGTNGGLGAWELAARYSVLDLNDNEGSAGAATPVGGIRGGEQAISTIGLNWYPNNVVRFLLDYQNGEIEKLNGAGTADTGEDFQAVSLRTQVAF